MPENEQNGQQQGNNQGATGDATGQQAGANGQQQNGGSSGSEERRFTQAELDAIVQDRLNRDRQRRDQQAQRERDQAQADALREQQQYRELSEQQATRIAELEPFQQRAERYQTALTTLLEGERKNLPSHITALLDKLDPAEQLEWIASNREAIGGSTDQQNGNGTNGRRQGPPASPNGNGQRTRADIAREEERALRASGHFSV